MQHEKMYYLDNGYEEIVNKVIDLFFLTTKGQDHAYKVEYRMKLINKYRIQAI